MYFIVVVVFSFVVTNLIFPKLAKAVADEDMDEAKRLTVSSLRSIVLVIAPLMAGLMVLSEPAANVIFGYGKMDAESVRQIGVLLKFYSVGMLGLGLNEILSKAFFSLKDSKTPMRNSVISMLVNIALAYILYQLMSTNGLALAAAFGSIINAVLNWICLARKYPDMIKRADVLDMFKSVLSAIVMAAVILPLYMFVETRISGKAGNIIICFICGAVGAVVYAVMTLLTGESDIKNILKKKG